jgi:peptidoglycan/LPS O-acetylase OafA/YrhL
MTRVYAASPLEKSSSYFSALTGLRAVVAAQVFFYHVTNSLPTEQLPFFAKWAMRLLQHGDTGVSVFFVLSGFLIAVRYAHSVELTPQWWRGYVQNRLARVYPIYFLLTALAFLVMLVKPSYNWYQWPASFDASDKLVALFANLTLTRGFFSDFLFLGVPTAWSLTVEESFYLSAPFLLLGLKRSKHRFYLYPALLLVIGFLLVLFCTQFFPHYGLMASMGYMLKFTFFGRCVEFIVGIGLAFCLMRLASNRPILLRNATLLGGTSLISLLLLTSILEHTSYKAIAFYVTQFVLPFPIATLLWGLAMERTWLQRLLSTKAFDLLGKSSYIFYLIHLGIIDTIFTHYVTDAWAVRLVLYTVLSIGLYRWVEEPVHKLLRVKPKLLHKPVRQLEYAA